MERIIFWLFDQVALAAAWSEPYRKGSRVTHPERAYRSEADPRWTFCSVCMQSTWFAPVYWAIEDCTDWECSVCEGVMAE